MYVYMYIYSNLGIMPSSKAGTAARKILSLTRSWVALESEG